MLHMVESLQDREKKLKETQAQLIQAGKLTALGQLSAGVAHEINQPLTSIVIWADLARDVLRSKRVKVSKEKIIDTLKNIDVDVDRIKKIITHLRDFSRQSELKFKDVSLNRVIDHALGMFGEQLRTHNIKLKLDRDPNLPQIYGDPNQLEQIVVNFITNAQDALDEKKGGDLIISTKTNDHGDVVLSVGDTGCGMSKKTQERMFEPFYTEKEVGKGAGLGLSIVYGILEDHKGDIKVKSKLGKGTTFTLTFPNAKYNEQRKKAA